MNVLEFEVHNQILTRIDSQDVMNKNKNVYKCRFTFEEDSDWIDANKFVIFKDGWGNSSTVHLGKDGDVLACLVPKEVLRGSYFQVSIYAGDLITTNNVSVALIQSGYVEKRHSCHPHGHYPYDKPYPHLHHPHHHSHNHCHDKEDIFVEIFDRLDNCVDSIVYDNNTLHLFSKDSLVESIYLPFINEDEFEDLVNDLFNQFISTVGTVTEESNGLMSSEDKVKLDSVEEGANKTVIDTVLDLDSGNAISNGCVTEALNGKEDSYDIVERIDDLIINLINEGD